MNVLMGHMTATLVLFVSTPWARITAPVTGQRDIATMGVCALVSSN